MIRYLVLTLSALSAPAIANGHYRAEPAATPALERFVARENVWRCSGEVCTSARSASRPAIVCAALVRQVGALRSFSVDGEAFDAEALASCNRRAR